MICIDKTGHFKMIKKPKNLNGMKCILCGKSATEEHHCIFNAHQRKKCDAAGLTVALCHDCHYEVHNKSKEKRHHLEQIAQYMWEQEKGTREEFMSIFHKNYLWDKEVKENE